MGLTAGNIWTGGSSNWNSTSNWSTGGNPDSGLATSKQAQRRSTAPSATVTIDTGATAGHMLFTSAATGTYTFSISGSGNSLTLSGIGIVDNSGTHAPIFGVGTSGSAEISRTPPQPATQLSTTGPAARRSSQATATAAPRSSTRLALASSISRAPPVRAAMTPSPPASIDGHWRKSFTRQQHADAEQGRHIRDVISDCGSAANARQRRRHHRRLAGANGTGRRSEVTAGATLQGSTTIDAGTLALCGTARCGVE